MTVVVGNAGHVSLNLMVFHQKSVDPSRHITAAALENTYRHHRRQWPKEGRTYYSNCQISIRTYDHVLWGQGSLKKMEICVQIPGTRHFKQRTKKNQQKHPTYLVEYTKYTYRCRVTAAASKDRPDSALKRGLERRTAGKPGHEGNLWISMSRFPWPTPESHLILNATWQFQHNKPGLHRASKILVSKAAQLAWNWSQEPSAPATSSCLKLRSS